MSTVTASTASPIRIFCFGDSLTSGYCKQGAHSHPYSIKLAQLLNASTDTDSACTTNNQHLYECIESGIPGETTSEMVIRLQLYANKGVLSSFNYCIILGGTNDLGSSNNTSTAESIINNIKLLHSIASKYCSKTIALTIPEHGLERHYISIYNKRIIINQSIQSLCNNSNNNTIIYCDLATVIPYYNTNKDYHKLYWDDHLHFTPAGYDRIGELLFETIKVNKLLLNNSNNTTENTTITQTTNSNNK